MIVLTVTNLRWIQPGDQPDDMCAHGDVELVVNSHNVATAEEGEWCVSAAAIHLLRTLTRSHTTDDPVGEQLIPCCGHFIVPPETAGGDVQILGCNVGINWQIIHQHDHLLFVFSDDSTAQVSLREWTAAVCGFADEVRGFYDRSVPRTPSDDFAEAAFDAMMAEWSRRRLRAERFA